MRGPTCGRIAGLVFPSHRSRSAGQALRGRPLRPLHLSLAAALLHAAPSRAAVLGLAHDCEPGVSVSVFPPLMQRLFVPSVSDIQGSFLNIFSKALLYFCVYGNKCLKMLPKLKNKSANIHFLEDTIVFSENLSEDRKLGDTHSDRHTQNSLGPGEAGGGAEARPRCALPAAAAGHPGLPQGEASRPSPEPGVIARRGRSRVGRYGGAGRGEQACLCGSSQVGGAPISPSPPTPPPAPPPPPISEASALALI